MCSLVNNYYRLYKTHFKDFKVIMKLSLHDYFKILKKYVFGATCIVILLEDSNLQPHNNVLTVAKVPLKKKHPPRHTWVNEHVVVVGSNDI